MTASAMADTTANTTSCTPSDWVNRLATSAATAPTANHTDTSAVVAASTPTKTMAAISQKMEYSHITNPPPLGY